jgi:hypothetical protein
LCGGGHLVRGERVGYRSGRILDVSRWVRLPAVSSVGGEGRSGQLARCQGPGW